MKPRLTVQATLAMLVALSGFSCHEAGYRTEVVGNGQGGVEVKTIPRDKDPLSATSPVPVVSIEDDLAAARKRIAQLETQVRVLTDEVNRPEREADDALMGSSRGCHSEGA